MIPSVRPDFHFAWWQFWRLGSVEIWHDHRRLVVDWHGCHFDGHHLATLQLVATLSIRVNTALLKQTQHTETTKFNTHDPSIRGYLGVRTWCSVIMAASEDSAWLHCTRWTSSESLCPVSGDVRSPGGCITRTHRQQVRKLCVSAFCYGGEIHLGTSSTTTTWAQLAIRNQPPIPVVFTKNGKFTKPGSFWMSMRIIQSILI